MTCQATYECALVLNNMAVLMIDAGAYSQALVTFRDAAAAIQACFSVTKSSIFETQSKIEAARDRLAHLHPRVLGDASDATAAALKIRVLTSEFNADVVELLLAEQSCAQTAAVAVVLLDPDFLPEFDEKGLTTPDFEAAIIVGNMGAAHCCLSSACSTGCTGSDQCRQAAAQFFDIAYNLLIKQMESGDNDDKVTPHFIADVIYIAVIAVTQWIQVLCSLSRHHEARKLYGLLVDLRSSVIDQSFAECVAPAA